MRTAPSRHSTVLGIGSFSAITPAFWRSVRSTVVSAGAEVGQRRRQLGSRGGRFFERMANGHGVDGLFDAARAGFGAAGVFVGAHAEQEHDVVAGGGEDGGGRAGPDAAAVDGNGRSGTGQGPAAGGQVPSDLVVAV